MKIIFMGTPDFARKSLQRLYDADLNITAVFTGDDKPKGRGMKLTPCPVKELALTYGTPVYHGNDLNIETIQNLQPDLIAVVAFGKILRDDILQYPPYGCINIHASILPKFRGAAPIQHTILAGETETGITSQYMAGDVDAGDIIFIRKTPVLSSDTSESLFERLGDMGAELLFETIEAIGQGRAPRTAQNHQEATFAPKITKEMSLIDWNASAFEIDCRVRALIPWPVASFDYNGEKIKVYSAAATGRKTGLKPGTITDSAGRIEIACKDESIEIIKMQAPGGKVMDSAEYLRGRRR